MKAVITRRQFVHEMVFTVAALYGRSANLLAGERRIFGAFEQSTPPLDAAAIRKLASGIAGHVITPEAPDYESSRLVNNRAYDRHPALIVHCVSASDVVRILDFAQRQSLPLAVRAGGHSAAGYGVCDGGVVIDLSGMKRVEVDAHKRVARADAGCLVGDLDQATQQLRPSHPHGHLPHGRNCRADARWGRGDLDAEIRRHVRQPYIGARGDRGRGTSRGQSEFQC